LIFPDHSVLVWVDRDRGVAFVPEPLAAVDLATIDSWLSLAGAPYFIDPVDCLDRWRQGEMPLAWWALEREIPLTTQAKPLGRLFQTLHTQHPTLTAFSLPRMGVWESHPTWTHQFPKAHTTTRERLDHGHDPALSTVLLSMLTWMLDHGHLCRGALLGTPNQDLQPLLITPTLLASWGLREDTLWDSAHDHLLFHAALETVSSA
jgi:hypothetical protein